MPRWIESGWTTTVLMILLLLTVAVFVYHALTNDDPLAAPLGGPDAGHPVPPILQGWPAGHGPR